MDQDVWNRDNGHLAQGAKMVAAALVSAVVTATVVIAAGQSLLERPTPARMETDTLLIRTGG